MFINQLCYFRPSLSTILNIIVTVSISLIFLISLYYKAIANDKKIILLFGDSIIAGYGLDEKSTIPSQLEYILQKDFREIKVINGGISGDTTSAGLARIEWLVKKNKPNIVLIALGGNDILRGVPTETTRYNLEKIINIIKKYELKIILSKVKAPTNYGQEYQLQHNKIYQFLSTKYSIPIYPFLLEKVYGNNSLMQEDGIHPNPRGAKIIAKDLALYLKDNLYSTSAN